MGATDTGRDPSPTATRFARPRSGLHLRWPSRMGGIRDGRARSRGPARHHGARPPSVPGSSSPGRADDIARRRLGRRGEGEPPAPIGRGGPPKVPGRRDLTSRVGHASRRRRPWTAGRPVHGPAEPPGLPGPLGSLAGHHRRRGSEAVDRLHPQGPAGVDAGLGRPALTQPRDAPPTAARHRPRHDPGRRAEADQAAEGHPAPGPRVADTGRGVPRRGAPDHHAEPSRPPLPQRSHLVGRAVLARA